MNLDSKAISALRNLSITQLDLEEAKVNDRCFKRTSSFAKLKRSILKGTPVTDAIIDSLTKLSSLELLEVTGTAISPEGYFKA